MFPLLFLIILPTPLMIWGRSKPVFYLHALKNHPSILFPRLSEYTKQTKLTLYLQKLLCKLFFS